MGANSFNDSAYGKTAGVAFRTACNEAEYEDGHNPYNGRISTNDSFVMKPLLDGETREDWEARMWDDDEIRKWGPCACVRDPNYVEQDGISFWWFAGWAAC